MTVAAAGALLGGCEQMLPGGDLGAPAGAQDAGGAAPPLAAGCLAFHSLAGVERVSGAVRTLAVPGGEALAILDDAVAGGREVPSLAVTVPPGATLDDCLAAASLPGGRATSALDPPTVAPLSAVTAAGTAWLYSVDIRGSVGVAAQEPAGGPFGPGTTPLWTSDRPPFGTAAVTDGTFVYALGCLGARFLDADCYVARAPVASPSDLGAYEYSVGGGRWSPRVDDAWPVTTGGTSFDVAWVPAIGRWLMAYVPPLGSTIALRSGLTPAGPWSAPVTVATCALADPDMFCAGLHLHPALATAPGTIVLSYGPATFSPDAAQRRAQQPDDWWPRFVALGLPTLP